MYLFTVCLLDVETFGLDVINIGMYISHNKSSDSILSVSRLSFLSVQPLPVPECIDNFMQELVTV